MGSSFGGSGTDVDTSLLSTEATLALIKAKTDNLDVALSTRTKPSDTQAVSGTVTANAGTGTFAVSGPITDTQIRATPLPVSGTVTANVGTGTQPVSGTFWQSTQPVSGTFWQATQPVSGTVTANAGTNLNTSLLSTEATLALIKAKTDNLDVLLSTRTKPADTQPVSGTFWQSTQPVSGTFWQATQPVSGTVTANAGSGTFAVSGPVTDAQIRATPLPVSGTVTANAAQSGTWTVQPGNTANSTAWLVKEPKDTARTHVNYYALGVAAGTTGTETAITLTRSSGTSATSSAASFVLTNAKVFRITSISVATRGHATATAQITTFNLRINTGGAVTTGSTPIVFAARSATAAVASAWDRAMFEIPDGFEITGNGTIQFGLTANAVYVTNAPTWDVNIIGYEY